MDWRDEEERLIPKPESKYKYQNQEARSPTSPSNQRPALFCDSPRPKLGAELQEGFYSASDDGKIASSLTLAGPSNRPPAPRNDSPEPEPESEEDYLCNDRFSSSDDEEVLLTSRPDQGPGSIMVVHDPPGALVEYVSSSLIFLSWF
jgi:hypothetical protein